MDQQTNLLPQYLSRPGRGRGRRGKREEGEEGRGGEGRRENRDGEKRLGGERGKGRRVGEGMERAGREEMVKGVVGRRGRSRSKGW